ncbi:hypothetical protein H6S82_08290 [Planktothrix sp. FACHB-1355]|uniref:Uncharacterized protein n=1 Tax=Aerosakkonema funiforme FACHB-1375 TaxID=2949571 RepID=A0A926VIE2_9CYAN|nr:MULTISPECIES: hypothetical protein [Oscillatoriales]MBD2184556.1 hypothetical protein [Aerosakkonema funiforme FACHB-1375]MBD3558855.1 hypothetical protein [Planktothrix sp. FACHB-1355]
MTGYEIVPITDGVFVKNADVFNSDSYLGRLWIFPTKDPSLNGMGITSEWFLIASTGQVVSGHVNKDDKWSISPKLSLLPSWEYTSMDEVFDWVFDTSLAEEYSTVQMLLQNVQDDIPLSMQVSNRPSDSDDNEDDDSTEESNKFNPQLDPTTFANLMGRLQLFTDLLASESELSIQAPFDEFDEDELFSDFEEYDDEPVSMLPLISPPPGIIVNERERVWWQNSLIDLVVEEWLERKVTEVEVIPHVKLTINVEEGYFLLRSDEDGHTLLSATLTGEVIKELNTTDASCFAFLEEKLRQESFERSAVEFITDINDTNVSNIPTKRRGIEYGD